MGGLLNNPFAILRVSVRADRDAIARATDEAVAGFGVSDSQARQAQRDLVASKPRLKAEISWLPNLAPQKAHEILAALTASTAPAEPSLLLEAVDGLAKANLAAHFCAVGRPDPAVIGVLIESQESCSVSSVREILNGIRKVAGFPPVTDELVEEALKELRKEHCEAGLRAVTAAEHPGRFFGGVVKAFIGADGTRAIFLHDLVEDYDRWALQPMERLAEEIRSYGEKLRAHPKDRSIVEAICSGLALWDEYCQPQQLANQSRGLEEPRSKDLYEEVRGLCLLLANEHQQFMGALEISRTLLAVFPELPSVVRQLREDVQTLEGLLKQAKAHEALSQLVEALEAAQANTWGFTQSVRRGEFRPDRSTTPAGRVCSELTAAVTATAGTDEADAPWVMVRTLAIKIHNDHQETAAVIQLLKALLALKTSPPLLPNLRRLLEDDLQAVEHNRKSKQLAEVLTQENLTQALVLIEELLKTSSDQEEKRALSQTRQRVHAAIQNRDSRKAVKVVVAAVVVLVVLGIIISNGQPSLGSKSYTGDTSARSSRSAVSFNRTDSAYLESLSQQIDEGKRQAQDLEGRLRVTVGELDGLKGKLQRYSSEIEGYERDAQLGLPVNKFSYQSAIDSHNSFIPEYNNLVEEAQELQSEYEAKVARVNGLVTSYNSALAGGGVGARVPPQPTQVPPAHTTSSEYPQGTKGTPNSPVPAAPSINVGQRSEYTVRPGDTLSRIAQACGTTVGQLMAFNSEVTGPNKIFVGQKITIPDSSDKSPPMGEQERTKVAARKSDRSSTKPMRAVSPSTSPVSTVATAAPRVPLSRRKPAEPPAEAVPPIDPTPTSMQAIDAENRIEAAKRLKRLGYEVDWRNQSLMSMIDAENRIEAANRLKRLGYEADWRSESLMSMIDAENRIEAAKRLKRLGYEVDWRNQSLMSMIDAENRIEAANRLKRLGYDVDWQRYSLFSLLEMERKRN